MSVYKLSATGITNSDNVASLDIRADGHITGMHYYCHATGISAADEGADYEVSFGSVSGVDTNDTLNVILHFGCGRMGLVTSGGHPGYGQGAMMGVNIPVSAGERIYLHRSTGGTLVGTRCNVLLYVEDGLESRSSHRRR